MIYNLKDGVPQEILMVSHNGFNYDYHFIIKELVEDVEKSITLSVPIEKK